jgi:hypothetical protein
VHGLLRVDCLLLLNCSLKHLVHGIHAQVHLLEGFVLLLQGLIRDGGMLALDVGQGVRSRGGLSLSELVVGDDLLKLLDLREHVGQAFVGLLHNGVEEEGSLPHGQRRIGVDGRRSVLSSGCMSTLSVGCHAEPGMN